jgi:hypothetical protein
VKVGKTDVPTQPIHSLCVGYFRTAVSIEQDRADGEADTVEQGNLNMKTIGNATKFIKCCKRLCTT